MTMNFLICLSSKKSIYEQNLNKICLNVIENFLRNEENFKFSITYVENFKFLNNVSRYCVTYLGFIGFKGLFGGEGYGLLSLYFKIYLIFQKNSKNNMVNDHIILQSYRKILTNLILITCLFCDTNKQ
jgi:hypothetical protein